MLRTIRGSVNLVVNIDPGKNAFPSREQQLDTHTPDVADKWFRLAFSARPLGVVDELTSQSFEYIATVPRSLIFSMNCHEPPEWFYIGAVYQVLGAHLFSPLASDLIETRSRNRGWFVLCCPRENPCTVPPKVDDVHLP